jgi:hypothetical protein
MLETLHVHYMSTPTLVAASQHNMHKIYQLSYIQYFLMISKQCTLLVLLY